MSTFHDSSHEVIAAAIEVHRELGPGFLESAYERALSIELNLRGIPHERQLIVPLLYKGQPVGEHRLDILVNECLVVELKAAAALDEIHFSIVRSYMRALNTPNGLLLNFATMPLTIKRVGSQDPRRLE